MEHQKSYEITVNRPAEHNCITLLYGSEDAWETDESREIGAQEEECRAFCKGLAWLFAAAVATVVLLMI